MASAVLTLEGESVDPVSGIERARVFVFLRTTCPIANRLAPEISRLAERYATQGIDFWLVYVDPAESREEIELHRAEYQLSPRIVRDSTHELVERTGVRVTPDVAVLLEDGELVYAGRIHDQYVKLGVTRVAPRERDLELVLERIVAGERPSLRRTEGVGCWIEPLRTGGKK